MEEQEESATSEITQEIIETEIQTAAAAVGGEININIPNGIYELDKSGFDVVITETEAVLHDNKYRYTNLGVIYSLDAYARVVLDGKEILTTPSLTKLEILARAERTKNDRRNLYEEVKDVADGDIGDCFLKINKQQVQFTRNVDTDTIHLHAGFKEMFPLLFDDKKFLFVHDKMDIILTVSGNASTYYNSIALANRVNTVVASILTTEVTAVMTEATNRDAEYTEELPFFRIQAEEIAAQGYTFYFECGSDKLCVEEGIIFTDIPREGYNFDLSPDIEPIVAANFTSLNLFKNREPLITASSFNQIIAEMESYKGKEEGYYPIPYVLLDELHTNEKIDITYELSGAANSVYAFVFFKYVEEE